jgi:ribonucleoside-diphosphate reductase alpha chain
MKAIRSADLAVGQAFSADSTVEVSISRNASLILQRRYLRRDSSGRIIETPPEMLTRVARAIAAADTIYDNSIPAQQTEEKFYRFMASLEFLPNSPTLMNAGTTMGQLSACYALPVDDSIQGIFDAVKHMALVQQSGGGTGFSFSRLRPKGDVIASTMGISSGPVSFMRVFDLATNTIKQGGKRRGANMGILRVDHPDIIEFIGAKTRTRSFENFNLSVAITDEFMEKVQQNERYDLTNPRSGKVVKQLNARSVFRLIAENAWRTGDPGVIFIDEINRHNPTPRVGTIECTNPCGELPLLPYESCTLGSINLSKMVTGKEINWDKLRKTVKVAVHFLDNVIDVNKFPITHTEVVTRSNRKIGLGVMGFADMLVQLEIPYDTQEGVSTAEQVMRFVSEEAREASAELAKIRGAFPNFHGSIYDVPGAPTLRNATLTTVAPTGTLSIIAGCSSGIEPIFAICYVRRAMEGQQLLEVNPFFESVAKQRGFFSEALMKKIARSGSIQEIKQIPKDVRRVFVTALDICPEWHVRMQVAFQKYCDNAVSKTVNLPHSATRRDVQRVFELAYKLKCKGITVFRYGSKKEQVLCIGTSPFKGKKAGHFSVHFEYAGNCTTPYCPL